MTFTLPTGIEDRPVAEHVGELDRVGPDVVLDIENPYAAEHPELPTEPRELLNRYVDAGHLGVQTGRGFHDDGSR